MSAASTIASIWQLVYAECIKLFSRPRTYIGYLAIGVIVGLIQLAMWADGKTYLQLLTQSVEQHITLSGNIITGNMVCFIILQMLIVHLPLLVALVAGDGVAGEVQAGTIRLLLTKPVSRAKILFAKWLANLLYIFTLVLFLGVLAYPLSLGLFGDGDMIVLKSDELVILQQGNIAWRYGYAFLIAFLSLTVIATLALMVSCFARNSLSAITISMSVVILFTIIGTLDMPFFDTVKEYLFTTHMIVWRNMFDNPIDTNVVRHSVLFLVVQTLIFYLIAHFYFTKKDIVG